MRVEDADVPALPGPLLDGGDDGALAQIVGILFEGETEDADSASRGVEDGLHGTVEVALIARQDGFKQRQLQIHAQSAVIEGAQILRQARASKREAGLQVRLGDIEADIAAER